MRRLLFFFFLLSANVGQGGPNYIIYHEYINKAEFYFVRNQVDSSLHYYDLAFNKFDYIFIKDAAIAAQISILKGDTSRVRTYLLKGAQYGLSSECIALIPLFAKASSHSWFQQLRQEIDRVYEATYLQYYKEGNRLLMTNEWAERYFSEQDDKTNAPEYFEDDVVENVNKIKTSLATIGYPGDMHLKVTDCRSLSNEHAFISLAHYPCSLVDLEEDLLKAVKKGEIHPRDLALLHEYMQLFTDRKEKEKRFQTCISRIKDRPPLKFNLVWYKFNDSASLTDVEKNRKNYGIVDLITDRKKDSLEKSGVINFYLIYK